MYKEIMEMRRYFTLHRSLGFEPHYQMHLVFDPSHTISQEREDYSRAVHINKDFHPAD